MCTSTRNYRATSRESSDYEGKFAPRRYIGNAREFSESRRQHARAREPRGAIAEASLIALARAERSIGTLTARRAARRSDVRSSASVTPVWPWYLPPRSLYETSQTSSASGFQEDHLRHAFVGVDLGGQRRGVGELQRDVALPLGLERA